MILYGALGVVAVIIAFVFLSKKRGVEVVHLVPPDAAGPAVPPRLAANKQPIVAAPPSPVGATEPDVDRAPRPRPADLDAAISQALRAGNKIEAIKHYREKTGLGLKEAKDAIEAMMNGAAPPPLPARAAPVDLDTAIQNAVRAGQKIEAIKLYREKTGLGLKEAKDAIDALFAGGSLPQRSAPPSPLAGNVDAAIDAAINADQLIQAIKLYREKTGLGLAEAKRAVEARRDQLRR